MATLLDLSKHIWEEYTQWPLTLNKEEYANGQSSEAFMTFDKECIQWSTTLPECLRHI